MKVLRPEVQECLKSHLPGKHGMFDLMDDLFLSAYNVTDNEFDFMLEHATEEEKEIIVEAVDSDSFSLKRKSLEIRNKYLKLFNGTDGINNYLHL
jgi:tRNA pseudouridine-54 N-methylase